MPTIKVRSSRFRCCADPFAASVVVVVAGAAAPQVAVVAAEQ
jgi:hypothetical protein